MYSVTIGKFTLGVHFSFLALVGILSLIGGEVQRQLLVCLICCLIHELGHLAAMLLLGLKAKAVILYGGGILISRPGGICSRSLTDCLVLLAGPLANIVTAVVCYTTGLQSIVGYSIFCAVFNLLPFSYFDGGRILEELLPASRITLFIKRSVTVLLFFLVISVTLNFGLNISLVLTFACIILCEIFGLQ